MLYNVTAKV